MKLTGIATFGFGVIIPMSLATRDSDNEPMKSDTSLGHSTAATLTTTTPREHTVDQPGHPGHELDFGGLQNSLKHPGSASFTNGFNSPTRIPSTLNVNGMDKTRQGQTHTETGTTDQQLQQPQQLVFTEQLFAQVVRKAELGRVMMDIENI